MEKDTRVGSPFSQTSSVTSLHTKEIDTTVSGTMLTESSRSSSDLGVMRPLTLREVWEIYIKAVKSQDQSADNVEKQSYLLNVLLKMCAAEMRKGQLPNFSDMRSVCSQLCKEFMSDILHITNRSEDDDVTQLQKYLLEGRGWILLQVIHNKGIQTLTGYRDFAKLLVSMLPWCLKFPLKSTDGRNIDMSQHYTIPSISDCFQNILQSCQTKRGQSRNQSVPSTRINGLSSKERLSKDSSSTGKRRFSKRKSYDSKDTSVESEEESSETKDDRSKSKLRKKFRYTSGRGYGNSKTQPKADSESDDDDIETLIKSMNITDKNLISGFELCIMILELLHELILSDLNETPSGKMISPVILPSMLQCLVGSDSDIEQSRDDTDLYNARIVIKRHLVRVVVTCSGITAAQPNGMNNLISHRVIEQVLTSGIHTSVFQSDKSYSDILQDSNNEASLLSDIVIGILLCLTVVFDNLPFNLSFIKTALHLVEEFDDHKGFQMLEQCIMFNDWLKTIPPDTMIGQYLDDEPIKVIGSFLNTLKVVRVNYVHSMKCVKRKHLQCSYTQYYDHHHDILGVAAVREDSGAEARRDHGNLSLSGRRPSQSSVASFNSQHSTQVICLVSSCTQFLLDLLTKVTAKITRLDLLKTIYSSGICCCMKLDNIMTAFVTGVQKFSPAVRMFSIDTLNCILLEHFSGGLSYFRGDTPSLSCSFCEKETLVNNEIKDKNLCLAKVHEENPDGKGMDSGIDSSDISKEVKMSAFQKLSKWRAISQLKVLLYSNDEAVAISIAKHLLVLAIKGNPYLKAELFFSLYSHALDCVRKESGAVDKGAQKLSKSVQVHCLSALPYLLQANCVTKVFLSRKGVRKLCELLEDDTLRAPVLRIFEALVVLDDQKLTGGSHGDEEECPCPYNGGRVIDAFITELSKRSFSNNEMYQDESDKGRKGRIRRDSVVISKFSLPVLVDLWETCAKLCLHSHVFVSQFSETQSFVKTEALLMETLDVIMSPDLIGHLKSHGSLEAEDSGLDVEPAVELERGELVVKAERREQASFFQRLSLFESLIIVSSAGHKHQGVKKYIQLKSWQRLRERFTDTVRLPPTKLKLLLDTVMNAAMPQFVSLLEFSYSRNIALVHVRDDDVYDEDEVRQLLQSGSDEDNDILTEIGYDADSEETNIGDTDKDKKTRCCPLKPRLPHKVYFPTTFGLLFDLLVLLWQQDYHDNSVISAVLYKLLQNVRMDVNLTKALCEQKVSSVILGDEGFWDSLLKTDSEDTISENLLGLLEHIGQYRLESHDLQKILMLFQHSDINMEKLLSVFLTILEKSPVVSHHSVKFPVIRCERSQRLVDEELLENGSFELPPGGITPLIKTMSDTVTNLFMSNFQKTDKIESDVKIEQEVWTICALLTGLKDTISWPPLQVGVTVCMWVCLQKEQVPRCMQKVPIYDIETGEMKVCQQDEAIDSTVTGYIHVVSIGTKEKLLELWADALTGSLMLRLTSEVSDIGLVVKECKLNGVISPDKWQHLIVSYKEGYEGSTVMGNVNIVIDGWENHQIVLDHAHSCIRSRHKSSQLQPYICIGHTVTNLHNSQLGACHIGHMMLLKGAPLSKEQCFHLYTLGPNNRSILKCDSSTISTVYAPHLNKNTVLQSRIDYDTLVGIKRVDFTELRNNLLLSYKPSECKQMLEYPPVTKLAASQIPSNLAYAPDAQLTQQPKVLTPVFQGHLHSDTTTSLEMAIEESGGIAAILFLVAKVYERCPESMDIRDAEKIQSEVLKVLMCVMHHSSQLQQEYLNIGGHALLCKVLTSSRSVPGPLTLKVIMDAATTESLYRFPPDSTQMVLKHKTDAVIRDATIIEHLVFHWLIWERCSQSVMEMLFAGLACLVQEQHPHQNYNIKQYQAINIVSKIFKIYQERIQEGFPSLSISVGASVVSILQNMAGSPPDYVLILEICDFLLNVHPAANTYINHSKSLFYFNLSWGQPPSPLTKWKIGLGQGLASSTPVKITYNIKDKIGRKIKRNLSDSFIKEEEEETTYPEVNISNQHDITVLNEHDTNSGNNGADDQNVDTVNNLAQTVKENVEETRGEPEVIDEENKDDISDKDENTREITDTVKESLNGQEAFLTSSTDLHVSTGIPDNFESLYKTSLSCDDSDNVKLLLSDDNIREEDKTKRGDNAHQSDISIDTGLGLNIGANVQVELDRNVLKGREIVDDDEGDVIDDDSDETEEASVSRDNLSLNFDEDNAELLKLEKGLIAVCVGLLKLLTSVILTMPDGLVEKTFRKSIINAPTFIVLAQNSSAEVRENIIKLISVYLERCNHHSAEEFFKMDGFHLLSAQLFQYPTHSDQMEAAVSIVLQRPFKIDEGLRPEEVIEDLTRVQQYAIPLMLSLLSNTLTDLALCHNSIQFCCKLFKTSDVVATVMIEQGVIEVISNMLLNVLKSGSRDTDVEGMDESEILLGDLFEFFKIIAIREFSASGLQHYQHFEDIVVLLQDLESTQIQTQGIDSMSVQTLRTIQQQIFVAIMELVETTSEEVSQQSTMSFFSKQIPSRRSSSTAYANNPSSFPSLPAPRNLSSQPQHFSLSGTFARLPFRKKSPGGYFVQSDHPYHETLTNSGSGDSDSSHDSWLTGSVHSTHTVNLPVTKELYSRTKSIDISHGRLSRSNSLLQTMLSMGKRKKLVTVPISQNELIERLKKVITFAVDSAMFADRKPSVGRRVVLLLEMSPQSVSVERGYMRKLFTFIYKAFEVTLPQEKSSYKKNKNVIMWGAKDVLRVQLGRLLGFMLSGRQDFDQRAFALSYIAGEQRGFEVLKMIVPTQEVGNDLAYFIYDLMTHGQSWLSRQQNVDGSKMINHLKGAGYEVFSPSNPMSGLVQERLNDRKKIIESRYESQKTIWLKRKETSLNRIFHQFDNQSARLSDSAMEVTQTVTHSQTLERNKFVEYLRQKKTDSIEVKKQWQEIVQNLTHERALWYDEKSYPQSWQLNPTEGPCRVRKRLQRGHLGILPKFLKKEFQHKLSTETVDPPLIYLFEDDHQISDSAALIYQLHKNKKIRHTSTCRAVSPVGESKGELLIGEDSVFFVADEAITDANYTQVLLGNKDQLSMTWPFEDVVEIHNRWYELMDTAIEIFLTNGKTCLLAFKSTKERDDIFHHLMDLELPNRRDTGNLLDVVDKWQNGQITNFEYLTYLNKKAGRTFNDLMQYPVMPFILRDYTSDKIDLRDISVYRDLSKPVSVQDPKNEQKFKMNYEILKSEYDKFGKEGITGLRVAPYHYGSHYSNSGGVLHFLVRVPPFTKMFLSFQDNSFDIPDRTFHNVHTSWRLSSAESNTDVKELIPEFFSMHEFLLNPEGFEFGVRQNGEIVDNVILPPWCGGNPRQFVLVHRQALESEYVTESICMWVDLVFGYKQRGETAVKAINVFHPATYFGLDVSSVKNSLDRKAIQTMVRTYGQTPRQLFRIPHPRQNLGALESIANRHTLFPDNKLVSGLKWGAYLGSPDRPKPDVVWKEMYRSQVASLIALPADSSGTLHVFGISTNSSLLVQHSQDKQRATLTDTSGVVWAAILTWGQQDGLVRIINGTNKPPLNFIKYNQSDEITCCASVPDLRHLFFGGSSGVITIYNTKHNPAKESELQVFGHKRCLYGHKRAINCLVVCKPYSIMVSASQDATCIIWDLNRLSYVRSIKGYRSGVQVLAVSDTLGDIASACHYGMGSQLYIHTVNGEYVAMVTCEDTINCLTYSTAAEGVSINVVAGGLSSGVVRLWSSWDLTPVRDLVHGSSPVISLTFTKDSQKLYVSSSDGGVTLWMYAGQPRLKSNKLFKPYLY